MGLNGNIHERELRAFIEATVHFFGYTTGTPPNIGTPFLRDSEEEFYTYTGVIGISGERRGCVYFSAEPEMLREILRAEGEPDLSHDALCDLVGEIANTISGNVRRELGNRFMIAVPVVLDGKPERLRLPEQVRAYVIPVEWRGHRSLLIIALE